MVPKRITADMTSSDLDILLRETCVAEFVHAALCIISVGVVFISDKAYGVVFYLIFALGNVPFILIQRYNRPHLKKLRLRMLAREERLKNANLDLVM